MSDEDIAPHVRLLRLIIPAMAMGVIVFAAVVVYLITGGSMSTNPDSANVLLLTLVALAGLELVAYVIIRNVITGKLRRKWVSQAVNHVAPSDLAQVFFVITLVGAAMAEGLSLFGVVILLLTGNWLALVAPALGLLLLALHFPSADKFNRFATGVTGQYWG